MSGRTVARPLVLALAVVSAVAGARNDSRVRMLPTLASAPSATRETLATTQPVIARHAMVVSAQHLATMAGMEILERGGNAIDAAVAVGYAEAVVHPCCGNIGGGGFMTIHLRNGQNLFLNFREKAPLKATPTMFQDAQGNVVPSRSTDSYLGVGVPGTVMGLDTALAKYGTMSLREVMAPAIKLAREGYVLRQGDVDILDDSAEDFAKHANVAAIFLNRGRPFLAGQRLVEKQLARTLEQIADGGTDAFYKGPIARAVVAASDANGGILSMQDFADYTVQWGKPIQCSYHGYIILSAPPPSSGGTTLCEILQIIKPYPFDRWGSTTLQSIINVVDYGMNVQQAVNAPRMHQQWYPQEVWIEDGMLSSQSRRKLEEMGYRFRTIHAMGADEAILIDPKTGVLEGANDRRRPAGLAAGY